MAFKRENVTERVYFYLIFTYNVDKNKWKKYIVTGLLKHEGWNADSNFSQKRSTKSEFVAVEKTGKNKQTVWSPNKHVEKDHKW